MEERAKYLTWVALAASSGTLVCCALPIVLVMLGFGAAVAAMTASVPVLIALSIHKAWVFAVSGLLLAAAGWLVHRSGRQCPVEPALAARCRRIRRWNLGVLGGSAVIWGIGFFAAYLALPLRLWLEGRS